MAELKGKEWMIPRIGYSNIKLIKLWKGDYVCSNIIICIHVWAGRP